MVSSTAMMLITTSSSIRVKPRGRRLPVMVGHSVESLAGRERGDIEYIDTRLRLLGSARIAAQTPGGLGSGRTIRIKWIARQPAHEIDHDFVRTACVFDPLVQHLQVRRIPGSIGLHRDVAALCGLLVGVDSTANVAQCRAQFAPPFPLDG